MWQNLEEYKSSLCAAPVSVYLKSIFLNLGFFFILMITFPWDFKVWKCEKINMRNINHRMSVLCASRYAASERQPEARRRHPNMAATWVYHLGSKRFSLYLVQKSFYSPVSSLVTLPAPPLPLPHSHSLSLCCHMKLIDHCLKVWRWCVRSQNTRPAPFPQLNIAFLNFLYCNYSKLKRWMEHFPEPAGFISRVHLGMSLWKHLEGGGSFFPDSWARWSRCGASYWCTGASRNTPRCLTKLSLKPVPSSEKPLCCEKEADGKWQREDTSWTGQEKQFDEMSGYDTRKTMCVLCWGEVECQQQMKDNLLSKLLCIIWWRRQVFFASRVLSSSTSLIH